jgi:purine catabolism regulator
MHIKIFHLLEHSIMKNSIVLAGKQGLGRYVGDVSMLDSPDAANYLTGEEFIVTTAYFFRNDPVAFKTILRSLNTIGIPALGIKTRFFPDQTIPQDIIDLCNELGLPLIELPDQIAYMQINELVNLNLHSRTTGQIKSRILVYKNFSDILYREGTEGLLSALHEWTGCTALYIDDYEFYSRSLGEAPENLLGTSELLTHARDARFVYPGVSAFRVAENNLSVLTCSKSSEGNTAHFFLVGDREFTKEDHLLLSYMLMLESKAGAEGHAFQSFWRDFLKFEYTYGEAVENAKPFTVKIPDNGYFIHIHFSAELTNNQFTLIGHAMKRILGHSTLGDKSQPDLFSIYADIEAEILENEMKRLYELLQSIFPSHRFSIYVGNQYGFEEIRLSYEEALSIREIRKMLKRSPSIYIYEHLGFYRLLSMDRFERNASAYITDILSNLENLDNVDDYLMTLKCYLDSGLNHSKTSKAMFVHPNTIRYRIQVIESKCNMDLNNTWDRVNMEIALYIKNPDMIKG